MNFENLMNAYAARHQLGSLDYGDNSCQLMIDDQIEVTCLQANGQFCVYCDFARLPNDSRPSEELLLRLLEKNLALLANERISMCIDPDQQSLAIYSYASMNGLTVGGIEELIATIGNYHEFYLQWVEQSSAPAHPGMMMMP